jgi:hypothetical protein
MSESRKTLKVIEFTWKVYSYSQQKLKNGPGKGIRSQAFSVDCEGDLTRSPRVNREKIGGILRKRLYQVIPETDLKF